MIGPLDDRGIMLDHDDGVARRGQSTKHPEQAFGIARMQADGRFVEAIEGIGKGRTQRAREMDPLRLAAREGPRLARERQILQAHIHEIDQTMPDLSEQGRGTGRDPRFLESLLGPTQDLGKRALDQLSDVAAADLHGERIGLETCPAAILAGGEPTVAGEQDADVCFVALALEPPEEAVDATETAAPPLESRPPGRFPLQNESAPRFSQVLPGHIGRYTMIAGGKQHSPPYLLARGSRPWRDRSFLQGPTRVGDHLVEIEAGYATEPLAGGAGAQRAIEGEEVRDELSPFEPAVPAGEATIEKPGRARLQTDELGPTPGEAEGCLERLTRPRIRGRPDRQTIDHHRQSSPIGRTGRVGRCRLRSPGQFGPAFRLFVESDDPTIEPEAPVTLPTEARRDIFERQVRKLQRRNDEHDRAFVERCEVDQSRIGVVAPYPTTARGTYRLPDMGPEEPEMVVDLGDRPHGGAGIADRILLRECDRRWDVADEVDVRALHPIEKEASIGGHGLDEASLPFGVEGVEDQTRLARPRDPGHDRQRSGWNRTVDPLEVVGARPADLDRILHRRLPPTPQMRGMRPVP